MATKLGLYNGALRHLGERQLANLQENRRARRELDSVYTAAVKYCLESASWNCATREVRLDYDPDLTPQFGYSRVFEKPDDWVCTQAVSLGEYLTQPLIEYKDQGPYLFADSDLLYLQYISDDASYGGDLTMWPESFTLYVEYYMAWLVCLPITGDKALKEIIKKDMKSVKGHAQSVDNMNEPTKFLPRGSWANSRLNGYRRNSRERAP